ncbi:head-tail adaptor protein [Sinorhizobium meliloti]|uniref:head-tail adaptor protein n=1 Tax=Rhizobium meliloti TaxID=382 RepID=UPI003D6603A8
MLEAGKLTTPIALWKKTDGDDGYGNSIPGGGPWAEQFRNVADKRAISGSETVIGSRLSGIATVEFWTRWHPSLDQVTSAWEVRETRTSKRWAIKGPPEIDPRRRFVKITAQTALTS